MGVAPLAARSSASRTQQFCASISHWMTPGDDGVAGEVALDEELAPGDGDPAARLAVDDLGLVEEKHGLAVRQEALELFLVHATALP